MLVLPLHAQGSASSVVNAARPAASTIIRLPFKHTDKQRHTKYFEVHMHTISLKAHLKSIQLEARIVRQCAALFLSFIHAHTQANAKNSTIFP